MSRYAEEQIESETEKMVESQIVDFLLDEPERCICKPCESPAYGAPGYAHCAACCYGSLIEEYNHDCPVAEHREWAHRQFPLDRLVDHPRRHT